MTDLKEKIINVVKITKRVDLLELAIKTKTRIDFVNIAVKELVKDKKI